MLAQFRAGSVTVLVATFTFLTVSIAITKPMPSQTAIAIATGQGHSCALTSDGTVKCWGANWAGQLGDGSTVQRTVPNDVIVLSGVTAVAVGDHHVCALTAAGAVKCWGYNSQGQLGDSSTVNRLVPVDVNGLTSGIAAIAAGAEHTCAITGSGGVKCWGWNLHGQLGDGTTTQRTTPVDSVGLRACLENHLTGMTTIHKIWDIPMDECERN